MILKLMEWLWPGDWAVRAMIGRFNSQRLEMLRQGGIGAEIERKQQLLEQIRLSPRAIATDAANAQHYEVPSQFYQTVLGKHLKYSCGFWPEGVDSLEQSEAAMLELYCKRAALEDGQSILDLGCGWGSLTLFLAERYPNSQILAVSNSNTQREYIQTTAQHRQLTNIRVLTCDINCLELPSQEFDRILSIEMLEHVRNYAEVFRLLESALKINGRLFLHVFAHRQFAYTFDVSDEKGLGSNWMQKEFFSGGMMPSLDLFLNFAAPLELENQWAVPGTHYQKTCNAWLDRMRNHKAQLVPLFKSHYQKNWRRAWLGWQLFFLACAELFGHQRGQEWLVHHTLWKRVR